MARWLWLPLAMFVMLAPGAAAAPRIVSTIVVGTPVPGEPFTVAVRAIDAKHPITSLSVRAVGEDGPQFGSSACGLTRRGTDRRTGSFAPGTLVTLSAPYAFAAAGVHLIEVTVGSGGCKGQPETTATTLAVAVTLPALPPLPTRLRDTAAADCANADRLPDGTDDTILRRAMGCLLNAERVARGLKALRPSRRLRHAAGGHTRDMATGNFLSHTGSDGDTFLSRLKRARYWPATTGENIGFGTGQLATPRAFVNGWMASDPHRENILTAGFRQIGIGVATNTGRTYVTTDLGRR